MREFAVEEAGALEAMVSVCSLWLSGGDGGRSFGIETAALREVVGVRGLRRVPMTPGFVAGVMPYRGEVLTVVSLRAVLGMAEPAGEGGCVVVLEDDGGEDAVFGLLVDAVGGVVTVERTALAANPATVGEPGQLLFAGAYRLRDGLMVRLEPGRLSPGRLRDAGLGDGVDLARKLGRIEGCGY